LGVIRVAFVTHENILLQTLAFFEIPRLGKIESKIIKGRLLIEDLQYLLMYRHVGTRGAQGHVSQRCFELVVVPTQYLKLSHIIGVYTFFHFLLTKYPPFG